MNDKIPTYNNDTAHCVSNDIVAPKRINNNLINEKKTQPIVKKIHKAVPQQNLPPLPKMV